MTEDQFLIEQARYTIDAIDNFLEFANGLMAFPMIEPFDLEPLRLKRNLLKRYLAVLTQENDQ